MNDREPRPVGEDGYDVTQGHIRYNLNGTGARTAVFDFRFDAQGNAATGVLQIFIGENTGSMPWAIVKAGDLFQKALSVTGMGTVISIVPIGAATGLVHVTIVPKLLNTMVTH